MKNVYEKMSEWNVSISELLKHKMLNLDVDNIDRRLEQLWNDIVYIREAFDFMTADIYCYNRDPDTAIEMTRQWFGYAMDSAFRADLKISEFLGRWVHPMCTRVMVLYLEFIEPHRRPGKDLPDFVTAEISKYMNGEETWSAERWINGVDQLCFQQSSSG